MRACFLSVLGAGLGAAQTCPAATELQNGYDAAATGVLGLIKAETWQQFFSESAAVPASCAAYTTFTRETLAQAVSETPGFFSSGDYQLDARDLSAFLALVGSASTGWWSTAPCGPEFWGLCKARATTCDNEEDAGCGAFNTDTCGATFDCTAVAGKKYYARGPMLVTGNMNYAELGYVLYNDSSKFLNNPELLETDAVVGWKSALWLYDRKSYAGQPTAHQFMLGQKSFDFKFQSGFAGAMSSMGGYCAKTCGAVEEAATKAENSYKRFTTLMGAKLCGLPTEWTTCGGTKFPQGFEAECRKQQYIQTRNTLGLSDSRCRQ